MIGLLLFDGLTNASDHPDWRRDMPTTFGEAQTILDYQPVVVDGLVNTIDVFGYWLGIPPEHNPGRAGAEALLDQRTLAPGYAAVHRFNDLPNWQWLATALGPMGVLVRPSNYGRSGRTALLYAESTEQMDACLAFLAKSGGHSEYYRRIGPHDQSGIQFGSFHLLGWMKGALLGISMLAGVDTRFNQVNPADAGTTLSLAEKSSDLHRRIKRHLLRESENFIIYVKDPANAARWADAHMKREVLEFCDELVSVVLGAANSPCDIVVISDHCSEPGMVETPTLPTQVIVLRSNRLKWPDENRLFDQAELCPILHAHAN